VHHLRMDKVLAVDVGGTHVKLLLQGEQEPRRFKSGPKMTPQQMVDGVQEAAADWEYDAVSVGIPTPIHGGRLAAEPINLGRGWVGFDFEQAFGKPTKVVNDAAMQAVGSYEGGKMLFLGLGTGLGSAVIDHGVVEPMELGHLPYRKKTFEDYVGQAGRVKLGPKKWREAVFDVVDHFFRALEPDYVVLGGGLVDELDELPPHTRRGDNEKAFVGGFRLWQAPQDLPVERVFAFGPDTV
jgi:predicted NBD/HSP70 family sugar kinase